jgi:hypothetical protein
MFSIVPLIAFLLLAVSVAGNRIFGRDSSVSLSITRKLNSTGPYNILKSDQRRGTRISNEIASIDLTNALSFYTASVGVGSPPTDCVSH